MSPNAHVREAEPRDAPALHALYAQLTPDNPRICVLPERIAWLRTHPEHFLLVHEEAGVVTGTVLLSLCPDVMFGTRPYALLENLVVDAGARGCGVGGRLLAHVEAVCLAHACTKVMLLSAVTRTGAHAFFERQGFRGDLSRGFKKYLPARQTP